MQVVKPGDYPTVSCNVISGDSPVSIQWSKAGGAPLPAHITAVTSSDRSSTIRFSPIAHSDQGEYICRASNEAGSAEVTAQVIVSGKQAYSP